MSEWIEEAAREMELTRIFARELAWDLLSPYERSVCHDLALEYVKTQHAHKKPKFEEIKAAFERIVSKIES